MWHQDQIVQHALEMLPNDYVLSVSDADLPNFLKPSQLPRALLISDKARTTPMFKSLALSLKGRMILSKANPSATGILTYFQVKKFPTLLIVGNDGSPLVYSGRLSYPVLLDWLEKFALPKPEHPNHYTALNLKRDASLGQIKKAFREASLKYHPDKSAHIPDAPAKFAAAAAAYEVLSDDEKRAVYDNELDDHDQVGNFYGRNPDIKNIDNGFQEFQQTVNSGDIWIVEYYLPECEPCQHFSSHFKKLPIAIEAANLKRPVKLAAVNCDSQGTVCNRMEVSNLPAIHMFTHPGSSPERYSSHDKTTDKLVEWIQQTVSSAVIELRSVRDFRNRVLGSKELWLVDFYHPNCGPCQALKPAVRRAAWKLQGVAKVGMFSCVQSEEANQFCIEQGVSGYPTIVGYKQGPNKEPTPLEVESNHPSFAAIDIATTVLKLSLPSNEG
eukprot:TRINITY_DN5478_c0_g1_i1.p1 TRINITY_DN5478_c0_g1~~TRINITY_DN5478_c0_g1_i1.p1  ORF type:complete len:442 (-),score=100.67 TRINITY_DN5478_c0_g1_i1:303-1628(-)